MQSAILKPLRLTFALMYFCLVVLLFSGLATFIPSRFVGYITWLQFVPSVLKSWNALSVSTAGFILTIISTLLFGRLFCSFACPLGILQDFVIRCSLILSKKTNKYKRPVWVIPKVVLLICILPLFLHNIFFLNLLDPFALSGKIFAGFKGALLLSLGLFLFFTVLSFLQNRWYCNVICPVGIFLGLLSKISLFRISINVGRCAACGRCEGGCKANCIDFTGHLIDFDRCVGCMDCLENCPEGAIKYRGRLPLKKRVIAVNTQPEDDSRRSFIKTAAGGAGVLAGLMLPLNLKAASTKVNETIPVMPPGAFSLHHFTGRCTACQLCVSSCPTHVLQPSLFEYGLSGLFQPKLDFKRSFCKYDCKRCQEVCPTGAIRNLDLKEKQLTRIGLAVFEKNLCLVAADHKPCAKCAEHCPVKAIELLPYLGDLRLPKIHESLCNGCGACEYYCPVRPDRAISVEALKVQQLIYSTSNLPLAR